MAIEERTASPAGPWIRRSLGIAVGLGGVACALTVLSLSMRAVLDIGGSCATGGVYEVARPCPDGVAPLTVGAIFAGLAFALLYAISLVPKGPSLLSLLWPALFLSLGWNFLDYGVEPPGGDGIVWGWVVCAAIFALIGGAPLLLLLDVRRLRTVLWGDDGPAGWRSVVPTAPFRLDGSLDQPVLQWLGDTPEARASTNGTAAAARDTPTAPHANGVEPPADVVSRLERLADLRRRGVLSSSEFEAAKREVLEGR
ncbi:MAG TPA: SHOCT domain-containing protein [Acidimicrobiales bacterium]